MKKCVVVLGVLAGFLFAAFTAYAAEDATWGRIKTTFVDRPDPLAKVAKGQKLPRGIEEVTFVTPFSSPPWYPPEEETESYRLFQGGVRWASEDLPVSCVVYTSDALKRAFEEAITPAFQEWDDHTSASIYGKVKKKKGDAPGLMLDGSNTVFWGGIDGPGGIVALTRFWYWSNPKEMVEFDIVFDIEEPWSTTGAEDALDVQSMMTHELGHTLSLEDLKSPVDGALTMYAYTWLGDRGKRSLGIGDILGIQALYGE